VRHGIVEGEPGIFPAPVARVLQRVGGWIRRRVEPVPPEPGPATDERQPGGRDPDAGPG
jgi:hypothetical protein